MRRASFMVVLATTLLVGAARPQLAPTSQSLTVELLGPAGQHRNRR